MHSHSSFSEKSTGWILKVVALLLNAHYIFIQRPQSLLTVHLTAKLRLKLSQKKFDQVIALDVVLASIKKTFLLKYISLKMNILGDIIQIILKFFDFADFVFNRLGIVLFPMTKKHVEKGRRKVN